MTTLTLRQVWLGYHLGKIDAINKLLTESFDASQQQRLINEMEEHQAAVRSLDKECAAEDCGKATQELPGVQR